MKNTTRQSIGLSGWLHEHLVGRLRDEVDCDDQGFEANACSAAAPTERRSLDAYRGFMDPRDRQVEGNRAYRA
jgi:hypothetical protein